MLRASPTRLLIVALWCAALLAGGAHAQDAEALRARHAQLRTALAESPFGRPLHLHSSASASEHEGKVYAVLEHSYPLVAAALGRAAHWCDILLLLVNVKRCDAFVDATGQALSAFITRKPRDPVESAHRVDFRYEVAAAGPDYLHVALSSASGPAGTKDYRLALESAPLDSARTFLCMSYSYGLGMMARIAMDAYLATSGRDKVGFSVVDRLPDGQPVYVDGVRGVAERNAMRYYLAVEAYLDSLAEPAPYRLDARLHDWYAGTVRHARQLRESIGPDEYFRMKRREASRAPPG